MRFNGLIQYFPETFTQCCYNVGSSFTGSVNATRVFSIFFRLLIDVIHLLFSQPGHVRHSAGAGHDPALVQCWHSVGDVCSTLRLCLPNAPCCTAGQSQKAVSAYLLFTVLSLSILILVDLVMFACLNFRQFLILGLFPKFRIALL